MPCIKLREAKLNDAIEIGLLGLSFHKEAQLDSFALFDMHSCVKSMRAMIRASNSFIVVLEADGHIAGAASATFTQLMFDQSIRYAQENFFYIDPRWRGVYGKRLLRYLETSAKMRGCDIMGMVALDGPTLGRVALLYERLGYKKRETLFTKTL
jgi:GNAT superfamily N-acetyltransferase